MVGDQFMRHSSSARQPRVGVIDLGSNTVLLLVLERGGRVVLERSKITRLAHGVFTTNRLDSKRTAETRAVVAQLSRLAREAGADRVVAVGTEAVRRARDGAAFLAGLVAQGLDDVRVLSGEEEAAFAIAATRSGMGAAAAASGRLAVVDVGGGSTEIAWTPAPDQVRGISLPLGNVRLTEAWLREDPPSSAELGAVAAAISAELSPLEAVRVELGPSPFAVAVAGTATTLAALQLELEPYDADRVEGLELGLDDLDRWIERLVALSTAARAELPGMEPGRADVLPTGALILRAVASQLGLSGFSVSGRGVRHGVAMRLLEEPSGVW